MIGVRLNHAQLCNGYAGYQSVVLFKRCTHVVMTVCGQSTASPRRCARARDSLGFSPDGGK